MRWSTRTKSGGGTRRGFTLIELMAVVVILVILAGVALPKFFSYAADAKEAATKGTLGGVRAGIANFYANKAISAGTPAYPSLAQLTNVGDVMQEALPENPYNKDNSVVASIKASAQADPRVTIAGGDGWAYYPGSGSQSAIFYANTSDAGEHTF